MRIIAQEQWSLHLLGIGALRTKLIFRPYFQMEKQESNLPNSLQCFRNSPLHKGDPVVG